jgi:hypothetical protein
MLFQRHYLVIRRIVSERLNDNKVRLSCHKLELEDRATRGFAFGNRCKYGIDTYRFLRVKFVE